MYTFKKLCKYFNVYLVQHFQALESQVWGNSHCLQTQLLEGPYTLAMPAADQSRDAFLQ
jgi:hypothetical protein